VTTQTLKIFDDPFADVVAPREVCGRSTQGAVRLPTEVVPYIPAEKLRSLRLLMDPTRWVAEKYSGLTDICPVKNARDEKEQILSDYLEAQFKDVVSYASKAGWNGEHALALNVHSLQMAKKFASLLSSEGAAPEVRAHPDGQVALTWDLAPDNVFTISFVPDGSIAYSGILGESSSFGAERLNDGEIPELIENHIQRHSQSRSAHRRKTTATQDRRSCLPLHT